MTDKELRRLSRTDLLEMLLEQSKEVERLQQKPHFGSTGYLRQHRQPQTST